MSLVLDEVQKYLFIHMDEPRFLPVGGKISFGLPRTQLFVTRLAKCILVSASAESLMN